jgi:hypothetical protein
MGRRSAGAVAIWHGAEDEALELLAVLDDNCPNKPCNGQCPVHQGLLDQRWVDGLLFARYLRAQLLKEEQG